jgi:hypothetical protein
MAKPSSGVAPKKGKKNRKHGRNKIKCARYLREDRRNKNKARRAAKRQRRLAKAAAKRA